MFNGCRTNNKGADKSCPSASSLFCDLMYCQFSNKLNLGRCGTPTPPMTIPDPSGLARVASFEMGEKGVAGGGGKCGVGLGG